MKALEKFFDQNAAETIELSNKIVEFIFNIATWITVVAFIKLAALKAHSHSLSVISFMLLFVIDAYFYWNVLGRFGVALAHVSSRRLKVCGVILVYLAPVLSFPFLVWVSRIVNVIYIATK